MRYKKGCLSRALARQLRALAGEQLREVASPTGDLLRGADVRAPEVSGGPDLRKATVWRARRPAAPGQSGGSRMGGEEAPRPRRWPLTNSHASHVTANL